MFSAPLKRPAVLLTIKREWCKGCGICVAFCPQEALFLDESGKVDLVKERCSSCGICAVYCPDFALIYSRR